jgi:hypothetical protein
MKLLIRPFFIAAFVILVVAIVERVAGIRDLSVTADIYSPGRLLEIAAMLMIFVIAMLLRQVRDELRKRNALVSSR